MNYLSNNNLFARRSRTIGFTLVEVAMSIAILGIIASSAIVVMNNCIESAIDVRKKVLAFNLARENMETLLAEKSLSEMIDFGVSEIDPEITWELTTEVIQQQYTDDWFLEARSVALYTNGKGEEEKVEFIHWASTLTEGQIKQIQERDEKMADQSDRVEYDEFLMYFRKRMLSYIAGLGFEMDDYRKFLKELNDEKSRFIAEREGEDFDEKEYDKFIADQADRERRFLVPDYLDGDKYDEIWDKANDEFDKQPGMGSEYNPDNDDSDEIPDDFPEGLFQ
jgi:prepilin-type N-terminal cleavage/methylation domain-containing protein